MKLFHDYTYHWWELGLLKLSLLALGIIIGKYFAPYIHGSVIKDVLVLAFVLPVIYLVIITLPKIRQSN